MSPESYQNYLMVDLRHGSMDTTIRTTLENAGISIVAQDNEITKESLSRVGNLFISEASRLPFSDKEVDAIHTFVKSGGNLICADQTWSWAQAGKVIAEYPLNQLGEKMGFIIHGMNAGKPTSIENTPYWDTKQPVIHHEDWWPSAVGSDSTSFTPIIRDEKLNVLAAQITIGKGSVFVFGHGNLLRDNPEFIERILRRRA